MHAEPDITLARPADARHIARLSRDTIEHGLDWSWTPPRVARAIADPHTNVIVARHRARLIGFAIMVYHDDRARLNLFAVATDYRRRGVGSALLRWLERTALVCGLGRIELELRQANRGALDFYRHHGFEVSGRVPGYYQGRETALTMTRELWTGVQG